MRKFAVTMLALLLSLVFAGSSFAAAREETSGASEKMSKQSAASEKERLGKIVSANRLIGIDVKNQAGETIGEIKDLLVDRESGRVGFVVFSKGGFMGVGDEQYAVPFTAFKPGREADTLLLTIDEKKLAKTPKRESGMSDEEYGRRVHEYYGQAPYWEGGERQMKEPSQEQKKSPHQRPFDPGTY